MNDHADVSHVNGEVCEQTFNWTSRFRFNFSKMNADSFDFFSVQVTWGRNRWFLGGRTPSAITRAQACIAAREERLDEPLSWIVCVDQLPATTRLGNLLTAMAPELNREMTDYTQTGVQMNVFNLANPNSIPNEKAKKVRRTAASAGFKDTRRLYQHARKFTSQEEARLLGRFEAIPPGMMAWNADEEGEWFQAIRSPPCGLDTGIFFRGMQALLRNLKGDQPMFATRTLKSCVREITRISLAQLKAMCLLLQQHGLVMLVTIKAHQASMRALHVVLLPVDATDFRAVEVLQKYNADQELWNRHCNTAPAPSNLKV